MTWAIFMQSLGLVFDPYVLLVIFCSAIFGLFVGCIPGLTATMATALLVPITFFMPPVPAVAAIVTATAMAISETDGLVPFPEFGYRKMMGAFSVALRYRAINANVSADVCAGRAKSSIVVPAMPVHAPGVRREMPSIVRVMPLVIAVLRVMAP